MATQVTLSDVIERLRAEGQLTRNTGTNSIKSVRIELTEHTTVLNEMLKLMQLQEERFKLGRTGQDTGGPGGPTPPAPPAPAVPPTGAPGLGLNDILAAFGALGNLGMLGRIAVIGIGTALGVVIGQFKAIQLIFPKTVGSIITKITDFSTSIKTQLLTMADSIKKTLRSAGTTVMGSITDFGNWIKGLFSGTTGKINQLGKAGKIFTGTIATISDSIGNIAKSFLNVGKMITGAVSTTADLGSKFSNILKPLKSFVGAIKSVAGVVGKLFVPITIALTVFDTITGIIDGYAEGGILGALEGGITGFFNSLIFGPLDMLKDLVSWIAGKLGFENFSAILDSFSFSELFSSLVSSLFGGVKGVFAVITDLFTFGEEDMTALGLLGKLTDLVYAPVNMAINYVRGLFGFEETDEPFKLQDWITDTINDIWNFFADIIPSIEDIEKSVLSIMPDWLRKLVGAPEQTAAEIVNAKMEEQKAELAAARDREARALAGENVYWGADAADLKKDQETIARLAAVVEAPNPQIAIINQELETLRAERQTLITEASRPRGRGGVPLGKADTSAIDAQIAQFEAELKGAPATTVTPSPATKAAAATPSPATNTSSTYNIAGQPVIPGTPLSSIQMAAIEMSLSMGNRYPAEIMTQYNKQKSGVSAPSTIGAPAASQADFLQSKISTPAGLLPSNTATSTTETIYNDRIMRLAETTLISQQNRLAMIEKSETERSVSPTIVVSAPTVAPVNNNVTGPTNISNQRVTAIGNGSGGSGMARFAN